MEDEVCEFKSAHPEIDAQLETLGLTTRRLEDEITKLRDARMADFNKMLDKLGEVHEKVNGVAAATAGMNGKLAVYGIMTTAAGAMLMFLLSGLFGHVSK